MDKPGNGFAGLVCCPGTFSARGANDEVEFLPQFLNRNEWVNPQIVTDGEVHEPKITGRFAGQTHPLADISTVGKPPAWLSWTVYILFMLALGYGEISVFTLGQMSGLGPTLGLIGMVYFLIAQFRSMFGPLRNCWKEPKEPKRAENGPPPTTIFRPGNVARGQS